MWLNPTIILFKQSKRLIYLFVMQFVNKLRYAKEGARDIMDRACADLPWQVWLEVDGKDIEIPKVLYFNEISPFPFLCGVCSYMFFYMSLSSMLCLFVLC